MSENSIHKDHRKRMREKYDKFGADAFDTHQLMEMLLFHSMRQGDTNPVAHNLLNASPHGALGNVSKKEMCEVYGIGENSANLLRISADMTLRLLCDMLEDDISASPFTCRTYIWLRFRNASNKSVGALFLNGKGKIVDFEFIAEGRKLRPEDYAEEIVSKMKEKNALAVILCHNHKNNVNKPSVEDVYLTAYLKEALAAEELELLAHYIVTDTDCVECAFE